MANESRALLKLCRALFKTSNLIGSDFKDVSALRVKRAFAQDSEGIHIQFSVSLHALGKSGKDAHDALEKLLPEKMFPDKDD